MTRRLEATTPNQDATGRSGDPVVRVLGGYIASVAAAVTALMLASAAVALFEPSPSPAAGPAFPTVFAMPAFLLGLAVSIRTGLRHPAIHVACGGAIGLSLGRLFTGLVDRPIASTLAGAVGGGVYW